MTEQEFKRLWAEMDARRDEPDILRVKPWAVPLWESLPGPVEVVELDGEALAVKKPEEP